MTVPSAPIPAKAHRASPHAQRASVAAPDRRPEADRLRRLQTAADGAPQTRALQTVQRQAKRHGAPHQPASPVQAQAKSNGPVQRKYTGRKKLRIGVIHSDSTAGVTAHSLPEHTYVWLLSNTIAPKDEFPDIDGGHKKTSPDALITANAENVRAPKWGDERRSNGDVVGAVFQSGPFKIPRQSATGRFDRNQLDYAFWRYAALKSYMAWQPTANRHQGWPDPLDSLTLIETIDSDTSGIYGETGAEPTEATESTATDGWLAEAGVYRWDWRDVAGEESITRLFGEDTAKRDAALEEFSKQYLAAETAARQEKSGDMFNIYFPEPATRLSTRAMGLLSTSNFGSIAITKGQQIGHKRESIGLIAGLVYLADPTGGKLTREKKNLKFNPGFVVTTGLGNRSGHFKALFHHWYERAKTDGRDLQQVDIARLPNATDFDQSYLNSEMPTQVNGWHQRTYQEMLRNTDKAGEAFFHPKA